MFGIRQKSVSRLGIAGIFWAHEGIVMIVGTTMLALLAFGADPLAEERHLATSRFTIPFRVQPEKKDTVREALLYLSLDRGKTWRLHSRLSANHEGFLFQATQDGPHWFTVGLLDHNMRQEPAHIPSAPVGQKIVIDTSKPEASLVVLRNNSDISIQWDFRDQNPNLASLRLECRTPEMPTNQWVPIQLQPGVSGSGSFPAPSTGAITVRFQASDYAGNFVSVVGESLALPAPAPQPVAALPVSGSLLVGTSAYPPAPGTGPNPGPASGWDATIWTPSATTLPNHAHLPAISQVSTQRPPPPTAKLVNQRQVQLDYEVGKMGPSGVGAVEVWTTLDEGESWTLASTESFAQTGMALTANPASPVRNKIPLNLQREGIPQGFTLVAKSKAGLGRPSPQKGELAQIRLEYDTTAPEATLFSPVPDPDQRNHLLLSWKASDKNLAINPVTIEWANQLEGPWHKIGNRELANTGRVSWLVPPGTPPTVHLRLTVKDQAGNLGVAQTQQPILVDLTIPEVNILGLSDGK